jgi:hypothetical protein
VIINIDEVQQKYIDVSEHFQGGDQGERLLDLPMVCGPENGAYFVTVDNQDTYNVKCIKMNDED